MVAMRYLLSPADRINLARQNFIRLTILVKTKIREVSLRLQWMGSSCTYFGQFKIGLIKRLDLEPDLKRSFSKSE